MRPQTYRVELSEEERVRLRMLTTQGQAPARVIRRAHMLLLASEGAPDHETAAALHAHEGTVQRLRKRYCAEGLDAALYDRPRPGAEPKLDARGEAFLVALACSDPPEDRNCWTMQLLADRLVAVGLVEEISDETVRRVLGKKQAQTLARRAVADPPRRRRVRLPHGRRAGRIRGRARPDESAGLLG